MSIKVDSFPPDSSNKSLSRDFICTTELQHFFPMNTHHKIQQYPINHEILFLF